MDDIGLWNIDEDPPFQQQLKYSTSCLSTISVVAFNWEQVFAADLMKPPVILLECHRFDLKGIFEDDLFLLLVRG